MDYVLYCRVDSLLMLAGRSEHKLRETRALGVKVSDIYVLWFVSQKMYSPSSSTNRADFIRVPRGVIFID